MQQLGYSEEDEELVNALRQIGYDVPQQDWEEIKEVLCIARRAGLLESRRPPRGRG